jgi:signal transduction histidine kinase
MSPTRAGVAIRSWARDVLKLTLISLLFVVSAFLLQGGAASSNVGVSFRRAVEGSFIVAFCIGGLSWLVMPRIASRIGNRPALIRWPVYLAVLTATAVGGTIITGLIYYYGFGETFGRSFGSGMIEALKSSIPITWVIGSLLTVLGTISGRLEATELALQTQQLDRERAEKLAAETQLSSLAARIQPHFLFNTLNSISALVREDPSRAEGLIEKLASLLRCSLDGGEKVPLEKELQLVADYLEIQQARFGNRLRYDLPSDVIIDATLPPFAVQSVVENSLKHVAARRSEGVRLDVRATKSNGALLIDITDDGPGFSEDAMRAGHGLDNLHRRLQALYGEEGRLEFLRHPDRMTVRVRVPMP